MNSRETNQTQFTFGGSRNRGVNQNPLNQTLYSFGASTQQGMRNAPQKASYFMTHFNRNQPQQATFSNIIQIFREKGRRFGLNLHLDSFKFEAYNVDLPFDYVLFTVDRKAQKIIFSNLKAINMQARYLKESNDRVQVLRDFLDMYSSNMLFVLADRGNTPLQKEVAQSWCESILAVIATIDDSSLPYVYSKEYQGIHYTTLIFNEQKIYQKFKEKIFDNVFINDAEAEVLDWDSLDDESCPLHDLKDQISNYLNNYGSIGRFSFFFLLILIRCQPRSRFYC